MATEAPGVPRIQAGNPLNKRTKGCVCFPVGSPLGTVHGLFSILRVAADLVFPSTTKRKYSTPRVLGVALWLLPGLFYL